MKKMESSFFVDHVIEKLGIVNKLFYRLLVIVGPTERGQEDNLHKVSETIAAPVVNVNLEVSRHLLELPGKQRPLHVANILDSIIRSSPGNTFIFKNIELLFNTALETDPIRLFKNISRNYTLIIGWNGAVEGKFLIYAAPGHPEYRRYPTKDLTIINLHASQYTL